MIPNVFKSPFADSEIPYLISEQGDCSTEARTVSKVILVANDKHPIPFLPLKIPLLVYSTEFVREMNKFYTELCEHMGEENVIYLLGNEAVQTELVNTLQSENDQGVKLFIYVGHGGKNGIWAGTQDNMAARISPQEILQGIADGPPWVFMFNSCHAGSITKLLYTRPNTIAIGMTSEDSSNPNAFIPKLIETWTFDKSLMESFIETADDFYVNGFDYTIGNSLRKIPVIGQPLRLLGQSIDDRVKASVCTKELYSNSLNSRYVFF